MTWLLAFVYGLMALISLLNLLLMRRVRPNGRTEAPKLAFLIPARNEAENLERLLPQLLEPEQGQHQVYVYDDNSDDGTADVAIRHGVKLIRGGPLPSGWTGKNHACHRLAQVAAEDSDADWWVFLDADVLPEPGFAGSLAEFIETAKTPVVSGFLKGIPGTGIEPLFLAWVGWVLLATDPFGLVARSGMGHNRFTNGQFTAWKPSAYTSLWPNERLRDRILEDVGIGRLLAKEKVAVEVVNLSRVLGVRMYETWRQALDGMSKNAYEIVGSVPGSLALAIFFLAVAWGWLAAPWTVLLLLGSCFFAAATVRYPLWVVPFAPLTISIGAFTILRSVVWHRRRRVLWKGRVYGGEA